MTKDIRSG